MKNKKTIIILILVLFVGIVGITLAYFANSTSVDNIFNTQPYGTTVIEEFTSPSNWLPGDEVDKTIVATNTGNVDEAVRISLSESWKTANNGTLNGWITINGNKSSHLPENEPSTDERVAVINFDNDGDWTYSNGYYYYNYKLAPNESTSSLIKSVTFNPKTKLDDTCVETPTATGRTITCNSSGDDYDNATYTLTFNIETIQYNKYQEAWGTDVAIAEEKNRTYNAQSFISKANPVSVTNYTDGNIHEMYTFNHPATEQTTALTDYRYIGDDPYNYIYFNCDSLNNQNDETCEVWRIIGVFSVDVGNGQYEQRLKLVRGSSFEETMQFASGRAVGVSVDNDYGSSDWNISKLKLFLNGDYYYKTGDASTYGLKQLARSQIASTKYYLGEGDDNYLTTIEEMYTLERGTKKYDSSRSIFWQGVVGLMYPSDYGYTYAKEIEDKCVSQDPFNECLNNHLETGWIYNSNNVENEYWTWLLSPMNDGSFYVFYVGTSGYLGFWGLTSKVGYVRPVVYLKASTQIVSGTGEESNPYKIGIISNGQYTTYDQGEVVNYNDEDYYVLEESDSSSDYVTLIKKNVLTAEQVNTYSTNYVSTNGEYPFYRSDTCNNSTQTSCVTNYNNSDIKKIVDGWSSSFSNDLKEVNGYKARLINEDEIYDNLVAEQTPSDIQYNLVDWLSSDNYWTMYISDENNSVNSCEYGDIISRNVYDSSFYMGNINIKPVINLKKCALNGTC